MRLLHHLFQARSLLHTTLLSYFAEFALRECIARSLPNHDRMDEEVMRETAKKVKNQ
jgi:hypothetical protein